MGLIRTYQLSRGPKNQKQGKGPKKKPKLTLEQLKDQADFEILKQKWETVPKFARQEHPKVKKKDQGKPFPDLSVRPKGRDVKHLIQANKYDVGSTVKTHKIYTGTKVKAIMPMHKSNTVPVFQDEDIIEITQMRRNNNG